MATNEQEIEILNGLIQTCKDGENGFRTAAEGVTHPDLKQLFNSYASQRARFANELQTEVGRLGGQAQEGGSIVATLHRGWMNIRSLVTGHDEAPIIAECERGESAAVEAYAEALRTGLSVEVESVVLRQWEQVQEAHARIRALEAVTAKT